MALYAGQAGWLSAPEAWQTNKPEKAAATVGMLAVCLTMLNLAMAEHAAQQLDTRPRAGTTTELASGARPASGIRDTVFGGYSGMTDTRNSTVSIRKSGQIDMTIRDFEWRGKPFEAPIYYGLRIQRWQRDPDSVKDVLREGTRKARLAARETMELVRSAMGVKSIVEPE